MGDQLVAVGAQAARANTLAERGALLASLGSEVAGLADRAFVDGPGMRALTAGMWIVAGSGVWRRRQAALRQVSLQKRCRPTGW